VIGDDAKRDIDCGLRIADYGLISIRQRARVFFSAEFFELIEDWAKDVGLVIRNRSGKIREILSSLNDRNGTLETHSGIDVPLRQGRE